MIAPKKKVIPQMEVHMVLKNAFISLLVLAISQITTKTRVNASIIIILSLDLAMQSLVPSITMLLAFLVHLHQDHKGFSRLHVKSVVIMDI